MMQGKNSSSDEKKHFKSGASSSGNPPPYECLTPLFLTRAAERMRLGMHYGKHNWVKGAQEKEFILDRLNHAFEHLVKAMKEIDQDIPMADDDLAAVVVNCMFAMEYQSKIRYPETSQGQANFIDNPILYRCYECKINLPLDQMQSHQSLAAHRGYMRLQE